MKPKPSPLRHLTDDLEALRAAGLLRARSAPHFGPIPSFASNDYLGLAARESTQAPAGAAGSRLLAGDAQAHVLLEDALCRWLDAPASLVFSSGYAANVGVLSALAGPGDLIVSDALNHASTVDGCRLSRATIAVTPHLDLPAMAAHLLAPRSGRAFVVTESYFSMDADTPDLARLRALCDETDATLIVDEAHAVGLFGPDGRGLCAEYGVLPDVLIGTFGKSFGVAGAFVAGSQPLIDWLYNRARSFVFSTGISPAVAASATAAIEYTLTTPSLRAHTHAMAMRLRMSLRERSIPTAGHGPIIPVILGDPRHALSVATSLQAAGIDARAVRPPTVPSGTARLRLTVTARHTPDQIDRASRAIAELLSPIWANPPPAPLS